MKIRIRVQDTRVIVPFDGSSPDLSKVPVSARALIQDAFDQGEYGIMPTIEPVPEPNWTDFNLAIFSDPDFELWGISQTLQSAIVATATNRNLEVLQTCYDLAKAQIAPSQETIATWQSIADQDHIGLIL